MKKVIYTVTFNPSIDYIVTVDDFQTGKVNRTSKEKVFAGGKGINVSIVLKNLGYESTALGYIAGFTGDEINRMLKEKGINTKFKKVKNGISRINVKLKSSEESEINAKGPAISRDDVEYLYSELEKDLKQDDILVLAGSIPDVISQDSYSNIMKRLMGKNVKTVVDATKELLLNVLEYHPFLIKPNNYELGEIFGVEIDSRDKAAEFGKKLQEKGAQNVLVSMAEKGAVLITEGGRVLEADAPKGKAVNSVGAGDSMVAGFIAGYLNNYNYEEAFKMGLYTGSASTFSEELATKEEVERLMGAQNNEREDGIMRIADLLDKKSIDLEGNVKDKNSTLNKMADLMFKSGKINDIEKYKKGVFAREEEGTTGIGEGIAIPHCKSDAVNSPGLAAMVVPEGVEFDAIDGAPVNLVFLIAAPDTEDNIHLDVLSRLSVLLMDESCTNGLKAAKSADEFIRIIEKAEKVNN